MGCSLDKYSGYIGIPYKVCGRQGNELDCWGFVIKIYKELYNIILPDYSDIHTDSTITSASQALTNTELYQEGVHIEVPQEGDILLFSVAGNPLHVGVALNDKIMIHCDRLVGSCIEDYRKPKWIKRLHKIYRHPHFNS